MEPNDRQRIAITSSARNNCVIAGPGTGKSKVLLLRAAYLVSERGVDPSRIVIVSFTNASVNDLREAIERNPDFAAARGARLTTFHSFALRCLLAISADGRRVYVADDWEEANLIDPYLKTALGLRRITTARSRRRDFNARWCQATESPDEWLAERERLQFQRAFGLVKGALDFTTRGELTYRWWRRLAVEPEAPNADMAVDFDHILVDEYQDLNECEHGILHALAERGVEVFVVGDPNQSIYEQMRHAHPNLCIEFPSRFPGSSQVVLDETYRCPPRILAAASALMRGTNGHGGVPRVSHRDTLGHFELVNYSDETAEASGIGRVGAHLASTNPDARILILVPTRQIGDIISRQLTAEHVVAFGHEREDEFDQHRAAIAYARLLGDPGDSLAAASAILLTDAKSRRLHNLNALVEHFELTKLPAAEVLVDGQDNLPEPLATAVGEAREKLDGLRSTGLEAAIHALERDSGLTGLEAYLNPAHQRRRVEEALQDEDEEGGVQVPPGVTISTFHRSKGLEADYVFLTAVEPEQFEEDDRSTPEEKRRLLFVGIARGRDSVFASYASRRYGPSRYMSALSSSPRRGNSALLETIMDELDLTPTSGTDFVQRYLQG